MQIHQKHNFAGGGDQFCEVCVEKHLTPARRQRLQQTVKQCHVRAQLYCQPCVLYPSTDHTKAWTQGILCKPRLHSLLKPEMPDSPASISLRVAVHETTAYNHIPALGPADTSPCSIHLDGIMLAHIQSYWEMEPAGHHHPWDWLGSGHSSFPKVSIM